MTTEEAERDWVASGYKRLVLTPCPDCPIGAEARARYLRSLDGMDDEQRQMTFANFDPGDNVTLAATLNAVRWQAQLGHGMVTLWGDYGRGKTHLMSAAINARREAGVLAAYVTLPELLRRVREGIGKARGSTDGANDVLERYLRVQTLALDEFGRQYDTEWAQEQVFHLIDRRYLASRRLLTMVATNDPPARWPEYVRSRLYDRRNAVIEIKGTDMRPRMEWKV